MLMQALTAPAVREILPPRQLNGADINEALLRKRHAGGDVARLANIEIEREHGLGAALLGPAYQPAQRWLADFRAQQSGLGADDSLADLRYRENIPHQVLAAFRHRQHTAPQTIDKIDLLDRIDPQFARQPELVDAATDVPIAVVEQIDVLLHTLGADAARDVLIHRHHGCRDRRAQRVIAIPCLDVALHAIPLEHILVGILDHAGFQRNQGIRDLEGGGRQKRLPRAILVTGDNQIVVGLVADEGPDCPLIRKVPKQIIADLAALRRDIGKRAQRKNAGGSEKTEGVTTDQDSTRDEDDGKNDSDDIL